jgi:hypothetical protein
MEVSLAPVAVETMPLVGSAAVRSVLVAVAVQMFAELQPGNEEQDEYKDVSQNGYHCR